MQGLTKEFFRFVDTAMSCKFCEKTFIVTRAIMSDISGYALFYSRSISSFSQSELRTHPCHVRIVVYANRNYKIYLRNPTSDF